MIRCLIVLLVIASFCDGDGRKGDVTPQSPSTVVNEMDSNKKKDKVSSLAKFFQEPQLGQSWYNPHGPTPTFAMEQTNGTVYTTRLGTNVLFDCKVTAVEQNLVSWFRRDHASLPVLLTVGFHTHSVDNRFSVDFKPPRNYRLRVTQVHWRDSGIYLCQLSVHPPSLIWARLDLDLPVVHLLDSDASPVTALHYDAGTTVEMMCRVKRPPLTGPASVEWEAVTVNNPGKVHVLHRDVERGGVRVETGRESEHVVSRLSLAAARVSDTGNYTCRLAGVPPDIAKKFRGLSDTIAVHVLQGENTEAIHSHANSNHSSQVIIITVMSTIWYGYKTVWPEN